MHGCGTNRGREHAKMTTTSGYHNSNGVLLKLSEGAWVGDAHDAGPGRLMPACGVVRVLLMIGVAEPHHGDHDSVRPYSLET